MVALQPSGGVEHRFTVAGDEIAALSWRHLGVGIHGLPFNPV
ncbi:hypothetical protein [Sphingomonas sp. Ant H11]|nr:hypothetical protein [Sphingomonas sp. Ant H11]